MHHQLFSATKTDHTSTTKDNTMLVLTRYKNEGIVFVDSLTGDRTVITVNDLRGDKVRIGIDAPQHIQIWRSEIEPQDQSDRRSK